MTYFGEFGYLNSSCIIVTFLSSSRDKFTLLKQNSVTDISAGFRPPSWCPSSWAPTWRLHTNRYKSGENVSPHIFHNKNGCDLNLGDGLCIYTFFLFPDSGLDLLNGFDSLFWSILNGVTLKSSNSFIWQRIHKGRQWFRRQVEDYHAFMPSSSSKERWTKTSLRARPHKTKINEWTKWKSRPYKMLVCDFRESV